MKQHTIINKKSALGCMFDISCEPIFAIKWTLILTSSVNVGLNVF